MHVNLAFQLWFILSKFGMVVLTLNDVEEIIQSHIVNNNPVERLKITHPRYNKDD